jgi:hypothetical protein
MKSPKLGDDSRILAEFPGCDGVFEVAGVWWWMTKSRQTSEVTTPVVRKGGGKKPSSGIKSKDGKRVALTKLKAAKTKPVVPNAATPAGKDQAGHEITSDV